MTGGAESLWPNLCVGNIFKLSSHLVLAPNTVVKRIWLGRLARLQSVRLRNRDSCPIMTFPSFPDLSDYFGEYMSKPEQNIQVRNQTRMKTYKRRRRLSGTWTPLLVNCWTLIHMNWRRLLMKPEVPTRKNTMHVFTLNNPGRSFYYMTQRIMLVCQIVMELNQ